MKNNLSSKGVRLFLFACLFIPFQSWGSSINYSTDSFESIIKKSSSQNKYFFVKFAADWCAPCKVMDQSANKNPTLVNFIQENLLAVKADVDQTTGQQWKDQLNACCLPTLVVFSPDGYELGRKEGSIPSSEFLSFLENAIGKKATLVFRNPAPSYTSNKSSIKRSSYVAVGTPQPQLVAMTSKGSTLNTSKWTLLISKHSKLQTANKEIKTLKNKLNDDIILTAKMDNQKLIYQVSIGNISNEQEAIRLRKKLKSKNIRSSIIKE